MCQTPSYLPAKLELNGDWTDLINQMYAIFATDFKWNATHHDGLRVIYNKRVEPDGSGKEEGFWHVISRNQEDDSGNVIRAIDPQRAKRLPWAKPLFILPAHADVKVFDYDHVNKQKGIRRYIWIDNYNYALVAQKKKTVYYWITAYYVDDRRDMQRRYQNRI